MEVYMYFYSLLRDFDNADTELLIYATSLLNKTLSGLSDQDSYYDETDFLERQGMEGIVQRYKNIIYISRIYTKTCRYD